MWLDYYFDVSGQKWLDTMPLVLRPDGTANFEVAWPKLSEGLRVGTFLRFLQLLQGLHNARPISICKQALDVLLDCGCARYLFEGSFGMKQRLLVVTLGYDDFDEVQF